MLVRILRKILLITRLSFRLGATFGSAVTLWYVALVKLTGKRTGRADEKEYRLKLEYNGKKFDYYLGNYSDYVVLKEVFFDREYETDLAGEPDVIVDLGSHVGASVIFFRLRYPDARIFAFEPVPETYAKLQRHIAQFNGITALEIAVGGENCKAKYFVNPEDTVSSSLIQRKPDQPVIELECKTLDTVMDELGIHQIDLLKIDVEGSEYEVLKNFKNLANVKNLLGELHLDLMNETKEQFEGLLDGFHVEFTQAAEERFIFKATRQ